MNDTIKHRAWVAGITLYGIGACLAYGHAWAHVDPGVPQNAEMRGLGRFFLALPAAVAWPAYVSVCLFESKPEPTPEKP